MTENRNPENKLGRCFDPDKDKVVVGDVHCPYCNAGQNFEPYGFSGDAVFNSWECVECEKIFQYAVVIEPVYAARESPCKDGHHWGRLSNKVQLNGSSYASRKCRRCGEDEYGQGGDGKGGE